MQADGTACCTLSAKRIAELRLESFPAQHHLCQLAQQLCMPGKLLIWRAGHLRQESVITRLYACRTALAAAGVWHLAACPPSELLACSKRQSLLCWIADVQQGLIGRRSKFLVWRLHSWLIAWPWCVSVQTCCDRYTMLQSHILHLHLHVHLHGSLGFACYR